MHAVGGVTNAKVGTGSVHGNDLSRSSGSGMEEEGCLPPAKLAKLSRYGFQAVGNASTELQDQFIIKLTVKTGKNILVLTCWVY